MVKPKSDFDTAQDTYKSLSKEQREKVLNRISQKTDMFKGSVAEQAFIDSVKEIQEEASQQQAFNFMYGNYGGV